MKSRLTVALAAVLSMTVVATQHASAQDYFAPASYDSNPVSYNTNYTATTANDAYLSRIEALESEIANMRSNMGANYTNASYTNNIGGCDSGCDGNCDGGCGTGGCTTCVDLCAPYCKEEFCPAWQFQVDMTLLRLHKEGGVQIGGAANEVYEMGFIASPRFALRRYNKIGMFQELKYFEFNHGTAAPNEAGSSAHVRVYAFDYNIGERFQLNRDWDVEISGGTRFFNYKETLIDVNEGSVHDQSGGIGGLFAIEMSRRIGQYTYVYGGARGGIVQGNHRTAENRVTATNIKMFDTHYLHFEFFTGTEYVRPIGNGAEFYLRYGAEWISYGNASSMLAQNGAATDDLIQSGADIGLGGVTVSMGFYR